MERARRNIQTLAKTNGKNIETVLLCSRIIGSLGFKVFDGYFSWLRGAECDEGMN